MRQEGFRFKNMNWDGNFKLLGSIPIDEIRRTLELQTESDWAADSFRQRIYEAHRATESLYLIYDKDMRHLNPTILPKFYGLEVTHMNKCSQISTGCTCYSSTHSSDCLPGWDLNCYLKHDGYDCWWLIDR
jgi:hypothetical protein